METLKHLQNVIMLIVKDIDELCRKNGITYYLCGGSAIGAVRHGGFIPWDDDFDILMDNSNYRKFIKVCREQLDKEKYYFQEGIKDWPLDFSKIKLRGTHMKEHEEYNTECNGIFIDIFRMDNVCDNNIMARWQYLCAKYLLCYQLSERTYKSASLKKKIMMAMAFPLKMKSLRKYFYHQTQKYNSRETRRMCSFFENSRWKTGVFDKDIFGEPQLLKFENEMLPVAKEYDRYLRQIFGDYMQLPPEEKRVSLHCIEIDFGKY